MDSKGKELLVLRRFSTVRHKFETCGVGCLLCWLLGYRANWWREEVVAEVEMPAGQKIATIYGIGGSGLQVVPEADTGVGAYRVLFPKAETAPARGSGPIFHILREGTKSPVGRIHRMLDENSGVCNSNSRMFARSSFEHYTVYTVCRIESPKWTNCRTFIVECTTILSNVRLCTHMGGARVFILVRPILHSLNFGEAITQKRLLLSLGIRLVTLVI